MIASASPAVSVIIPVHNRADRIRAAIDSVLSQRFDDLEVIVVDDGSDDDTAGVVRAIDDGRVKYVRQDNGGAASARNRGVAVAGGSIVAFLDSDDMVLPGWLENMMRPFSDADADVVCCGVEVVSGRDGRKRLAIRLPAPLGPLFANIRALFCTAGAYAMRRELFERIGGFDPDCPCSEHTELAMRLGALSERQILKIHNVMVPYVRYVEHGGPRLFSDPLKRLEGTLHVIEKHRATFERDPSALARYWGVAGVNAYRLGRRALASRCFLEGARDDPLQPRHWLRYLMSITGLVPPGIWTRKSALAED